MRIRLAILSLFFWIIYPMSIPADEQIPPVSPSGSISQANPDASQKAEPAKKEQAPDAHPQAKKNPSSAAQDDAKKTIGNQSVPSTETDATPAVDGTKPQPSPTPAVQDRRWIIRTPPPDSKKAKPAPVKPVKWISDSQKKQCGEYLESLSGAFLKARYYSIQGDSCACAEHADRFLSIYEKSRMACPDNFLENEGYSDRITRNMGWLKALGEKRCMGPATAPGGQSKLKTAPPPDTPPEPTKKGMNSAPQPADNHEKPPLVSPLKE